MVRSLTMGSVRLTLSSGGTFALDGGAMFGVVPRVIWSRLLPPDERNRIPLGSNVLLVETDDHLVMVDTGLGWIWSEKERDLYAIQPRDPLEGTPYRPEDVDLVILTHLHFDHIGGNVVEEEGQIRPRYPNARYVVQARELADALFPHERNRASYLPRFFEPLYREGRLEPLSGTTEILPGVWCLPTGGHTPGHQVVLVESEGRKAVFLADLAPTRHHLPLPYIMAYDLEPLITLQARKALYPRMIREEWLLVFEHERHPTLGFLREGERHPVFEALPEETHRI